MEEQKQGLPPQETTNENVGKSQEQVQDKSTEGAREPRGTQDPYNDPNVSQERKDQMRKHRGEESDVAQERTRESGE